MIHFDFEERYQNELIVGRAISPSGVVLLSIAIHVLVLLALTLGPKLPIFHESPEEVEARRQELLRRQQLEREQRRFVFVQPRNDIEALRPPPRADLSDLNRKSQAPERAVKPTNPLPFSRGNSFEQSESAAEERKQGPQTPTPPNTEPPRPEPEEQIAKVLPPADTGIRRSPETSRPAPGSLGDALRNLQRYVQNETFQNPQGGATDPGDSIQFDTKGVDFGPWVRRFRAQVKRNWFVPYAAMTFSGHVVLQFNIHKNGQITDLVVVQPSQIQAFTRAAYNAILSSNPVEPLPPEYPEPMALFTVTFYYNEQPPIP